jgi:hypothetical protein
MQTIHRLVYRLDFYFCRVAKRPRDVFAGTAAINEILKVELDRRVRFACPPQEETRSEIAFHLSDYIFGRSS